MNLKKYRNRKIQAIFALFGIFFLLILFYIHFYFNGIIFKDEIDAVKPSSLSIEKHQNWNDFKKDKRGNSLCITTYVKEDIAFSFPSTMKYGETKVVKIRYDKLIAKKKGCSSNPLKDKKVFSQPLKDSWFPGTFNEIHIIFHSSGFKISPKSTVTVPQDHPSPFVYAWTITAENFGKEQSALLEIKNSDNREKEVTNRYGITYQLNGENFSPESPGPISIPINVYFFLNITKQNFEIIKIIFGLIAFMLMFPILHDIIRIRFGLRRD